MQVQFRRAKRQEMDEIYLMGADVWSDGQPMEEYLAGCRASPKYRSGRWFVLSDHGQLCSSLLVHDFPPWGQQIVRGIGSVATVPKARGKGYGHAIVAAAVEELEKKEQATVLFLYSDIGSRFYEREGFRALPATFQTCPGSIVMVRMLPEFDAAQLEAFRNHIPGYF